MMTIQVYSAEMVFHITDYKKVIYKRKGTITPEYMHYNEITGDIQRIEQMNVVAVSDGVYDDLWYRNNKGLFLHEFNMKMR